AVFLSVRGVFSPDARGGRVCDLRLCPVSAPRSRPSLRGSGPPWNDRLAHIAAGAATAGSSDSRPDFLRQCPFRAGCPPCALALGAQREGPLRRPNPRFPVPAPGFGDRLSRVGTEARRGIA